MAVLKTILLVLLALMALGAILVRYALNSGIHVPTNQELINGTKAAIAAKQDAAREKKGPVKASEIKKLKKE